MIFQKEESLKGKILSIYDQTEENNNFHVCYYLGGDDTHILFQSISTRGYDNGFYLIPIDYIYRIDIDDAYTKRIEKLFRLHNQSLKENVCMNSGESIIMHLLRYAQENHLITSLFTESEVAVTGWISDVDIEHNVLRIEQLTQFGERDGIVYLNIGSIEKIISDSGEERCIQMLT